MNDKLQTLLSAIKYILASIDLIDSPEQLTEIKQIASENYNMIVLKDVNKYFSEFVRLNIDIQGTDWDEIINVKKIRKKIKYYS